MLAANHPSNGTFRVKRKVEGLPSGTVNLTCFVRLSPYFTDVRNVSPVTRFSGTETSNESLEVFSGDDNDDSAEAFRFPPGLLLLLLLLLLPVGPFSLIFALCLKRKFPDKEGKSDWHFSRASLKMADFWATPDQSLSKARLDSFLPIPEFKYA